LAIGLVIDTMSAAGETTGRMVGFPVRPIMATASDRPRLIDQALNFSQLSLRPSGCDSRRTVGAHGGASGRVRAHEVEREDVARRRREPQESALPEQARLLLSLQQAAGNQAVSGLIHRKVKVAPNKQWATKSGKGALPAIPKEFEDRYESYVVEAVRQRAEEMRDDKETANREFANANDFYKPLFDSFTQPMAAEAVEPSNRDRWSTLAKAVKKSGQVTEVPWASLGQTEGETLSAELQDCPVQRSGNTRTTACHGNTHQKLPKKVTVPNGKSLDQLDPHKQPPHTPYYEFLIAGKKNSTGIERGILDKDSGLIYITAHYTVGSFVWLSGAPGDLVEDWRGKVEAYWTEIGYDPSAAK
jgi:hypothetical protein